MATKEVPIVLISENCQLKGEFATHRDAVISGQVSGSFQVKGRLRVEPGGQVSGKVEAGSFSLVPGGRVVASMVIGTNNLPVTPPKLERVNTPPPAPTTKHKLVRGLEELAKFALGRK